MNVIYHLSSNAKLLLCVVTMFAAPSAALCFIASGFDKMRRTRDGTKRLLIYVPALLMGMLILPGCSGTQEQRAAKAASTLQGDIAKVQADLPAVEASANGFAALTGTADLAKLIDAESYANTTVNDAAEIVPRLTPLLSGTSVKLP